MHACINCASVNEHSTLRISAILVGTYFCFAHASLHSAFSQLLAQDDCHRYSSKNETVLYSPFCTDGHCTPWIQQEFSLRAPESSSSWAKHTVYSGINTHTSRTSANCMCESHVVRMLYGWMLCMLSWCRRGSLIRCWYWANWSWADTVCSRIYNNWCRMFRPRRPLSTAYKTKDTAFWDRLYSKHWPMLHQLLLILLCICSRSVRLACYLSTLPPKPQPLSRMNNGLTETDVADPPEQHCTHQMRERSHSASVTCKVRIQVHDFCMGAFVCCTSSWAYLTWNWEAYFFWFPLKQIKHT